MPRTVSGERFWGNSLLDSLRGCKLGKQMKVLVTGSSGLIGSEAVEYYDREGHQVIGVDNNMRAEFFGVQGDTTWNLSRLKEITSNFQHHHLDIRDRPSLLFIYKGKQVRDNIHSLDVIQCFEAFRRDPRPEEVYNLGGGERIFPRNRCR